MVGEGRQGNCRKEIQLCKVDRSYSLVTIRAQIPQHVCPWIHLTCFTHHKDTDALSGSVCLVSVFSLSVFSINPPPIPLPRNCFHRAACSTFLTPNFFILDIVLPLFFMNSQVIYLCSVSVCLARATLLCQEMKATQNGTRKWSTFWSHHSVLLQLKQAWKSASNGAYLLSPSLFKKIKLLTWSLTLLIL